MINNKPFIITYYSPSDKKTITRNALWTDKCRYWVSKGGRMLMTYFDIDADGIELPLIVGVSNYEWVNFNHKCIILIYGYIILTILGVI